ncbi:hypothetical protein ACFOD0_08880 [Shewanella intestini]|uniref:Uncharacterized protein n=1 Tax=Shewanella intestini TaxID=2017544 RepID=A0ABS5I7F2_9GAMM|nr:MULTISPECIES: hypothetical protein [Shewanella]MBR9729659.1 hypothetical protein [Shewanella intestini]MRG37718.1 hypothetical protein [Shewanella sp. XMDDZSB0408]
MNKDILVKLALVRYVLMPRQLLAFDEAYGKDSYEFNNFFLANKDNSITVASQFLNQIETKGIALIYEGKCRDILEFVVSLPFVDTSSFSDLNSYNPFDDFEAQDVDGYFIGDHFPNELDEEEDDASIFYSDSPEKYYRWYNEKKDKSLVGLLSLYIALLKELS